MNLNRVILIVIDGCGVGELPDADSYNDKGASTISNCASAVNGVTMPTCQSLGLGNIVNINGVTPTNRPKAFYGKMSELSQGKDSTTGHWEIAGIITEKPNRTYPQGFPQELVKILEDKTGVRFIGNCTASGTAIIEKLGEQHLKTKEIILYTSADSVLQLAAHEDIYPPEELYNICKIVRQEMRGEHSIGRVIARPFTGHTGNFTRTKDRKDFSLIPPKSVLNYLSENNLKTVSVGKINDLFVGNGITTKVKAKSTLESMQAIQELVLHDHTHQLIFANLIEFDELWGHRRDALNFAKALEQFDIELNKILSLLKSDDLLIITADHGCDPTFTTHTDHTREYVPLIVYNKNSLNPKDLGSRETFADIAKTIADIFQIKTNLPGRSFLKEIT